MAARDILGIDFGTTNTSAAWLAADGTLHVVPVTDKSTVLPTVLWFRARHKMVLGWAARQQLVDDPAHTVYGFKRFLGKPFKSSFVARHKDAFLYPLVATDKGLCGVEIYGEVVSLRELAQHVLARMFELAQVARGSAFDSCVLTVPAHFGFAQRRQLRLAAEALGVEVAAMINEPTAAALYGAKRRQVEQTLLVYDLGGGTFDVSLVALRGGAVQVMATGGDAFLGGADFDAQIAGRLAERFEHEHGVSLRDRPVVMQRITLACEKAKIALTRSEQARIHVPLVAPGPDGKFLDFEMQLHRNALETLTSNLIERTLGACDDVVRQVGLSRAAIDELLFVGGQSRMLPLRRRLSAAFKTEPEKEINAQLGVTVGAAILGRGLDLPAGPELADVVSTPLGVVLAGGRSVEVVARNTAMPCRRRVPLPAPPKGHDLMLGLYESPDQLSMARDVIGVLRVRASWLAQHPGAVELEITIGQDCSLTLRAIAADGDAVELSLLPAHGGS